MLYVILLESALELVPSEISSQKSIQRHAGKRGKKPTELLLDQNYHGEAMLKLNNHERRGRPDIVYLCLMTLLESPLCKTGLLRVYIHLQDGRVIEIDPTVRLPRNYDRFVGLFEQILIHGQVPPKGESLLKLSSKTLTDFMDGFAKKEESISFLAIEGGAKSSTQSLFDLFPSNPEKTVIIGVGAFPHGDMADSTKKHFTHHLELDSEVMMAWHVCGEITWIYTHKMGIIAKRYESLI